MMEVISPHEIALQILLEFGIDFTQIYNDDGGIRREQLKIINQFNSKFGLKQNAYALIHRLEKSKTPDTIQWAKNFQNVMVGTMQAAVMTEIASMPRKESREVIIKWIPSSAMVPDAQHSLYYGKVMSLEIAIKRGLATRIGCQCGMRVLKGAEYVENTIKKFKGELLK